MIILILCTFAFFVNCNGDCVIKRDYTKYNPIFIQKLGSEYLFIPNDQPNIYFGELNEITAVCSSGFSNNPYLGGHQYESTSMIVLTCVNSQVKIRFNTEYRQFSSLFCRNAKELQIYEKSSSQTCNKKHYNVGLKIHEFPIVFADICYDLDNMRLSFVHYIAESPTPVLSHQANQKENCSIKVEAPANNFFITEESANDLIKNVIGDQANFLKFKYEELYPSNNLRPLILSPLNSARNLNKFLGWTSLIQGNWNSFRNILKSRSKYVTYDVYLGTSDVIDVPTNDECKSSKKLIIEEYDILDSVPKYIWAYLKPNNNEYEEFVVIGVNSPYFEFYPKNETIFCDDMCHEIHWFTPLEKFRKISTFGYLFCCKKDQVSKRLDGFPVLVKTPEVNN